MAALAGAIPPTDRVEIPAQPPRSFIGFTWFVIRKFNWKGKLVSALGVFLLTWKALWWLERWGFGILLYYLEFVLAVSGRAPPMGGCKYARTTTAEIAWRTLRTDHWLERQRCLGNFDGRIAQGNLDTVLIEACGRFLNPRGFPGFFIVSMAHLRCRLTR
jgi:hypothetical protein